MHHTKNLSTSWKAQKHDSGAFEVFKDDKYYNIFHRGFISTARAQGLSIVCDPDYKPKKGDPYEQQLFKQQQSFVFCILIRVIQLILADLWSLVSSSVYSV